MPASMEEEGEAEPPWIGRARWQAVTTKATVATAQRMYSGFIVWVCLSANRTLTAFPVWCIKPALLEGEIRERLYLANSWTLQAVSRFGWAVRTLFTSFAETAPFTLPKSFRT